jgi:hypothetical protein
VGELIAEILHEGRDVTRRRAGKQGAGPRPAP